MSLALCIDFCSSYWKGLVQVAGDPGFPTVLGETFTHSAEQELNLVETMRYMHMYMYWSSLLSVLHSWGGVYSVYGNQLYTCMCSSLDVLVHRHAYSFTATFSLDQIQHSNPVVLCVWL